MRRLPNAASMSLGVPAAGTSYGSMRLFANSVYFAAVGGGANSLASFLVQKNQS